jgi:2,4-dienoyl-CoA reductase-like NADH-dependent reductase (Old Yellow Enzyme family)
MLLFKLHFDDGLSERVETPPDAVPPPTSVVAAGGMKIASGIQRRRRRGGGSRKRMYENVFEPISVGNAEIPNRIVRTAHGTELDFPSREQPRSPLVAYHEARARGGVGLSILEASPVHDSAFLGRIPLWSDEVVWGYERLVEAVQPHGMKLFQQLWHGGHAYPNRIGQAPWSASAVPNPLGGTVPIPMTKTMIDDMVGWYAAAARRVQAGGLDGVELHSAHGYLPSQFLSPATNHRTDEYGGPLENRVRFCQDVLRAIRAEVGPGFPIGIRLTADEEYEGGLRTDDAIAIAKLLEPDIDYLSVSVGSYYRFYKMLSPMDDPLGYEVPKTGQVARAVDVPTIVTGRIMTIEHASRIIADGLSDMVSMVRALIADPNLVRKSREGRAAEVRPCIGSSQGCVGGGGSIACVVNLAAGSESNLDSEIGPRPDAKHLRVLVAGGGPAGLEAARGLAVAGHEVHLAEMTNRLGGQVAIAASSPHRGDYGAITNWLAQEVERVGVKVMLRTFAEPDLIAELAPDVVVVATGSTPRRDGFRVLRPAEQLPGFDRSHVYTSWDVLGFGGRAEIGRSAVVYDDTGSYECICVSEKLLEQGCEVHLVTRFDRFPATVAGSNTLVDMTALPARERLLADDRFHLVTDTMPVAINEGDVEVRLIHPTAKVTRRLPADTVVMLGYNHPNRDLADALGGTGPTVHLVGDATGARTLRSAIGTAGMLARTL